jgi:hypothetical protein
MQPAKRDLFDLSAPDHGGGEQRTPAFRPEKWGEIGGQGHFDRDPNEQRAGLLDRQSRGGGHGGSDL